MASPPRALFKTLQPPPFSRRPEQRGQEAAFLKVRTWVAMTTEEAGKEAGPRLNTEGSQSSPSPSALPEGKEEGAGTVHILQVAVPRRGPTVGGDHRQLC